MEKFKNHGKRYTDEEKKYLKSFNNELVTLRTIHKIALNLDRKPFMVAKKMMTMGLIDTTVTNKLLDSNKIYLGNSFSRLEKMIIGKHEDLKKPLNPKTQLKSGQNRSKSDNDVQKTEPGTMVCRVKDNELFNKFIKEITYRIDEIRKRTDFDLTLFDLIVYNSDKMDPGKIDPFKTVIGLSYSELITRLINLEVELPAFILVIGLIPGGKFRYSWNILNGEIQGNVEIPDKKQPEEPQPHEEPESPYAVLDYIVNPENVKNVFVTLHYYNDDDKPNYECFNTKIEKLKSELNSRIEVHGLNKIFGVRLKLTFDDQSEVEFWTPSGSKMMTIIKDGFGKKEPAKPKTETKSETKSDWTLRCLSKAESKKISKEKKDILENFFTRILFVVSTIAAMVSVFNLNGNVFNKMTSDYITMAAFIGLITSAIIFMDKSKNKQL